MSSSEKDKSKQKKIAYLIERKTEQTADGLSISYDTTLLESILEDDVERANTIKLVKNILVSCNISYLIYITNKIYGYLKSLFFYNLFYFLFFNRILRWIYKEKDNSPKTVSLWKKLLLFNLPELIIIFLYHRQKFRKIAKSIFFLFLYLSERICYIYNNDNNNHYFCQIDQRNYDIYFLLKEKEHEKNLYLNNEKYLAKETFFDSVIAYPNANFGDFDFNNLAENEQKMYEDIFDLINEIEKKLKDDYKGMRSITTFIGNLSFTNANNFNVFYALAFKLAEFLIDEIYLTNYECRKKRNKLIEEKSKSFNQKIMENGYFLALHENVILLFRIKDKYKSFDESYNILYEDSQNLFKQYLESNIDINKIIN